MKIIRNIVLIMVILYFISPDTLTLLKNHFKSKLPSVRVEFVSQQQTIINEDKIRFISKNKSDYSYARIPDYSGVSKIDF